MNRWLLRFLAFSVLSIILIKFLWSNTPEWWVYGAEVGEVVFTLAISFIAAFIFYLIDIWLPNREKRKNINGRIAIPLSRMLNSMKAPIEHTVNKYLDEDIVISDISTIQLENSIIKVDLINENGPMKFIGTYRDASYLEYLTVEVRRVEEYCKQVYELPLEMEVDLVTILDKIRTSTYHESLKGINKVYNSDISIDKNYFSTSFPQYLELYRELHTYMGKNDINFTIENL